MRYVANHTNQVAQARLLPADLFDPKAIMSIMQLQIVGQPNVLAKFIHLFLCSALSLMQDFQRGVESNNISKIHYALHTLKSSSAHLGASRFIKLCGLIEIAAFRNDLETVAKHANALQMQFDEIEKALIHYLTAQEAVATEA